MNLKFAFLIVNLIVFSFSFSQESPEEMVDIFFEKYKNEGSTSAMNNIYEKNQWISQTSDDVVNLKKQMEELTEDFIGKYYGYELILEKKLSDSYVLKSFLVKYGRQPLRFTFQFYKPDDQWVFYGFSYDANLTEEVKEAAKLYNYRLN